MRQQYWSTVLLSFGGGQIFKKYGTVLGASTVKAVVLSRSTTRYGSRQNCDHKSMTT